MLFVFSKMYQSRFLHLASCYLSCVAGRTYFEEGMLFLCCPRLCVVRPYLQTLWLFLRNLKPKVDIMDTAHVLQCLQLCYISRSKYKIRCLTSFFFLIFLIIKWGPNEDIFRPQGQVPTSPYLRFYASLIVP